MSPAEQDRPDVAQARERWIERAPALDAKRLVFIDETGTKTNMTRRHGRAPVGRRVGERVPTSRWHSTTLLAAVRADGANAPMLLEGAIDTDAFTAWIEQSLAPTLAPGDIVVMDNLSSHKSPAVRALIEARGASLEYLPAYSPDLNPIEKMWSKVKALLRGAKARTQEALEQAVARALDAVTHSDIQGWFRSCGYTI